MITNSLEWNTLQDTLRHRAKGLGYSKDVLRMINNIHSEITQLSIAEIESRRGRSHRAEELLIKINQDIELVEEYLLVAALLG